MDCKAVAAIESIFTVSCLPETMAIAREKRSQIAVKLKKTTQCWPYEDRVLAWLEPSFARDIEAYHEGTARDMESMFQPHQLQHLDSSFKKKLLKKLGQ